LKIWDMLLRCACHRPALATDSLRSSHREGQGGVASALALYLYQDFCPHSSSASLALSTFPPGEGIGAVRALSEREGKGRKFTEM